MTVTFCGHKEISDQSTVRAALNSVLLTLLAQGADDFLLGGYGAFDAIAARAVYELKQQYPEIHSTLVIPYLNLDYNTLLYDGTTYPPLEEVPKRYTISKRNEWMVERADVVVAYVTHDWGGAAAMLRYAERKNMRIINISSQKS